MVRNSRRQLPCRTTRRAVSELWSQKLQYGADAPPITYTVNGKQYVAIVDGGSIIASGKGTAPHGDGVYVFALPG